MNRVVGLLRLVSRAYIPCRLLSSLPSLSLLKTASYTSCQVGIVVDLAVVDLGGRDGDAFVFCRGAVVSDGDVCVEDYLRKNIENTLNFITLLECSGVANHL